MSRNTGPEIDALVGARSYAFLSLTRRVWRSEGHNFLPFVPQARVLNSDVEKRIHAATFQLGLVLMLIGARRAGAAIYGGAGLWRILKCAGSYCTAATLHALVGLITGLSSRERLGVWLRLQYALLYGGAALNKLTLSDWRTGRTFRYFALELVKAPEALLAVRMMRTLGVHRPERMFGLVGAWFSMGMELLIATLYLRRSWSGMAPRIALWFHYMLLITAGGRIAWVYLQHALVQWAYFALPGSPEQIRRPGRPGLLRSALVLVLQLVALRLEQRFGDGMRHMFTHTPSLDAEDRNRLCSTATTSRCGLQIKGSARGPGQFRDHHPGKDPQAPNPSGI